MSLVVKGNEFAKIHPKYPKYIFAINGEVYDTRGRSLYKTTKPSTLSQYVEIENKDGFTDIRSVSKLMALLYLGRKPKGAILHFKDGDWQNCSVKNLEYLACVTKNESPVRQRMAAIGLQPTELMYRPVSPTALPPLNDKKALRVYLYREPQEPLPMLRDDVNLSSTES